MGKSLHISMTLGTRGKEKKIPNNTHHSHRQKKKKKTYLFINTMRKAEREKIEKFAA